MHHRKTFCKFNKKATRQEVGRYVKMDVEFEACVSYVCCDKFMNASMSPFCALSAGGS